MRGDCTVKRVAVDECGLPGRFAVGLEHVDCLDGIFEATLTVTGLDSHCRVNNHVGKEITVDGNNLRRHGCSGSSNNAISAQVSSVHCEVVLDVSASFLAGQLVAGNDVGGVDLLLDKFIGLFQ